MTRLTVFFYTVLLPIFTGSFIYFIESPGLISTAVGNYLPDGLWAFALVSMLFIIWNGQPPKVWLLGVLVLFVFFESSQTSGLISGTGDIIDLAFYIIFSGLAIFIHKSIFFKYAKR